MLIVNEKQQVNDGIAHNRFLQWQKHIHHRWHRFRRSVPDRETPAKLPRRQEHLPAYTAEERKADRGEIGGINKKLGL